jgi:hypothetical protein
MWITVLYDLLLYGYAFDLYGYAQKNLNLGIFPITLPTYASLQSEVVVVPNDASWLAEL